MTQGPGGRTVHYQIVWIICSLTLQCCDKFYRKSFSAWKALFYLQHENPLFFANESAACGAGVLLAFSTTNNIVSFFFFFILLFCSLLCFFVSVSRLSVVDVFGSQCGLSALLSYFSDTQNPLGTVVLRSQILLGPTTVLLLGKYTAGGKTPPSQEGSWCNLVSNCSTGGVD